MSGHGTQPASCVGAHSRHSVPAAHPPGGGCSLGYSVDVAHSDNKLRAGAKNVLEISLVRKGARDACFVTAYEEEGQGTRFRKQAAHVAQQPLEQDPWEAFDLSA